MNEQRDTCPFSGHDGTTINVRFFRGSRDGIITADEMEAEARSAAVQHKMGTALVSDKAPVSAKRVIKVSELVDKL